MVFNDDLVFGYGRLPDYYRWTTPLEYQLFATAKRPELISNVSRRGETTQGKNAGRRAKQQQKKGPRLGSKPSGRIAMQWTRDMPVLVRAMMCSEAMMKCS